MQKLPLIILIFLAGSQAAIASQAQPAGQERETSAEKGQGSTQQKEAPASAEAAADVFYTQNNSVTMRFRDRVYVGGATVNDGAYPNVNKDWLGELQTSWGSPISYTLPAMMNVLTNSNVGSAYAIVGGAQTLRLPASGAAIGTQGHAICNQASVTAGCWGFYGEAHRVVQGAGSAIGMEIDPVAHVISIAPTPNQQGNTVGHQIACGGEYKKIVQFDCSTAIQLAANGARFLTGLNVTRGSITGSNPSIALPTGNGITFYDAAGHSAGSINASFTRGRSANLNFDDNGLQIANAASSGVIAYFLSSPNSVNFVGVSGATEGIPPSIQAMGDDSNVDLALRGKGDGKVQMGSGMMLKKVRVKDLPACTGNTEGTLFAITDSTGRRFDEPLVGGGGNHVMGYCNGTGWTVH